MQRLSDQQWERIQEHFADENLPNDRPGRKPIALLRMLEGALWILNTGAQWHMLPHCYPNHKTAHGGFQQWCRNDALRNVLTDPAEALRDTGAIDERERSIDTTFASAKGDGDEIGKTKRGKDVKTMAIVERDGPPHAVSTHAANHRNITLVQLSFEFFTIETKPENLSGARSLSDSSRGCNVNAGSWSGENTTQRVFCDLCSSL